MVLSQIDKSIEYPAVKFVDSEDLDYDAQLYQLELFPDLEVIIALGKVKYIFIDKNILYIPVYLTDDGEVVLQMGVYEFPSNIYTSLLDEDNDFDISLLENPLPLLYKFINESFIRKELGQKKKQIHLLHLQNHLLHLQKVKWKNLLNRKKRINLLNRKKRINLLNMKKRINLLNPKNPHRMILQNYLRIVEFRINKLLYKNCSRKTMMKNLLFLRSWLPKKLDQETNFKEHSGHNWVEKFMKNENYGIIDNESGGDCLFATIRDAYSGIGKTVTVKDLRSIASNAATEEVFHNFKEQYDMYDTEVKTLSTELAKLQNVNKALKQRYSQTKDRDEKKKLVEQSKPIIAKFRQAKKEKKAASELLHEYRWMRGVDTLAKLKKKMRSCGFWAESWTIQILEMALNVKLIILSSFNYAHRDYDNVLSCGDMAPDSLVTKGTFKPKYYIILDYTGNHYKLITYKQKQIFEFNDIPVKIKKSDCG